MHHPLFSMYFYLDMLSLFLLLVECLPLKAMLPDIIIKTLILWIPQIGAIGEPLRRK